MANERAARVYAVTPRINDGTQKPRLVRAATKTSALRHVAEAMFQCESASQDALIKMLSSGTKIEEATAD